RFARASRDWRSRVLLTRFRRQNVADDLTEARLDLVHKEAVWLARRNEWNRARAAGSALLASVDSATIDPVREEEIKQNLSDASDAIDRAMAAVREARAALRISHRIYSKLELEWAAGALSNFLTPWSRARVTRVNHG